MNMNTNRNTNNRRMAIIVAAILSLILAMGLLAGCGGGGGGDSSGGTGGDGGNAAQDDGGGSAVNDTLRLALPNEIGSLDSAFAYDFTTNPVVTNISEGLLTIDNDGGLLPMLAESWEEVDSTTYVYNIRDDVTFSDGSPMTMDDVIFSLERYGQEDLASYLAWMYDNVESIEQTGDWQITVKLAAPDIFWKYVPATTAGHVHSRKAVEAAGDAYGSLNGFPVATGPYPVQDWQAGGDITLAYNEDYWGKADLGEGGPDVKSIVVSTMGEDTTRSLAIQTGQADIDFQTPSDLVSEVEKSENADFINIPGPGFNFVAFNCSKEPFDDVNVRRAVSSAIDAASIQEAFVKETGAPTNHLMVPDTLFIFEPERWEALTQSIPKYEYNIEKAKEYLSQTKYPDGFECTLLSDEYTTSKNFALSLQQTLGEIGITVNIDQQSNEEVTNQQFGEGMVDGKRPYDFGMFAWISDFPDPAGVLTPLLISGNIEEGGSNTAAYSNAKVDELLNEQSQLTDNAQRMDLLEEIQNIVQDEQPYYTLCQYNWLFGVSKRIEAPETVLSPSYIWNFAAKNITLAK
jgi:peptide/nickel transport system substrate-binding protein